ncbi:flavodoxin family protein [Planococcus sp. SSTMD024]|uniref:flavodoxin family protein n=1 Tax=Planococcus sp. SSTMD024 TaxID=3242163 RepID=UPI00351E7272
MGLRSNIKPMDFSLEKYENIFLGAPVWAGKTPPAINAYLKKASFKDKKVWLFLTKGDEKVPQQVIDSIAKRIEKKGGKVVDSLSITTKWEPKTNIPIAAEEVQQPVHDWLTQGGVLEDGPT